LVVTTLQVCNFQKHLHIFILASSAIWQKAKRVLQRTTTFLLYHFRHQDSGSSGSLRITQYQEVSGSAFSKKLKSYSNTLYWNENLREDTYKSKLGLRDFIAKHNLNLRPMDAFGHEELEERHKLLAQIIQIIWK
jgi:hypothetical protein